MIYQSHNSRSVRAITEAGIIPTTGQCRIAFDTPPLAVGLDVTCCQDACCGVETLAFAIPLKVAAQLIAVLTVDAEKQGNAAALLHGVEQCVMDVRKWHR